ncbi:hypothetical protein Salat_2423600 [Sesamum alatum]|uniref:Uncharacterized protein n=1 Tax=Sesamum alatum TaxID=300844 RepID=A0AAE2CFE5_9LAMI|nr:hypothetical protein Salat_2423600 [Sesamum alatum]
MDTTGRKVLINALRTIVTTGFRVVEGQYTNDAPPIVDLVDGEVDNDTQDCYVPTSEWCPKTGYARNDNGTVGDMQANVDVNVTSTASHKKLRSSCKKRKAKIIMMMA